jgi:hypothetical protein
MEREQEVTKISKNFGGEEKRIAGMLAEWEEETFGRIVWIVEVGLEI